MGQVRQEHRGEQAQDAPGDGARLQGPPGKLPEHLGKRQPQAGKDHTRVDVLLAHDARHVIRRPDEQQEVDQDEQEKRHFIFRGGGLPHHAVRTRAVTPRSPARPARYALSIASRGGKASSRRSQRNGTPTT